MNDRRYSEADAKAEIFRLMQRIGRLLGDVGKIACEIRSLGDKTGYPQFADRALRSLKKLAEDNLTGKGFIYGWTDTDKAPRSKR